MDECLFCDKEWISKQKLFSNLFFNVCYDGFPLCPGHVLIITKRHIKTLFNMNIIEFIFLYFTIIKTKSILNKFYSPDGYNIGTNINKAGGQTINHVHIHVIPRYNNDGGPKCGVRNVLPKNADYLK